MERQGTAYQGVFLFTTNTSKKCIYSFLFRQAGRDVGGQREQWIWTKIKAIYIHRFKHQISHVRLTEAILMSLRTLLSCINPFLFLSLPSVSSMLPSYVYQCNVSRAHFKYDTSAGVWKTIFIHLAQALESPKCEISKTFKCEM